MKRYFLIILLCSVNAYAKPVNFEKLYQSWGADITKADAKKAEIMWTQEFIVDRSCASCHSNNLKKYGAHIKTKKRIKPLSTKVNPKRLTSIRKINKWLKRNCKFTYKRECSPQEKMNFIEFIKQN